jgi:hypothetical protein
MKLRFRRGVVALGSLAFACFLVAFLQADRGAAYYNEYVGIYVSCFDQAMDAGEVALDCNSAPSVLASLEAHRRAYAIGEPFLNMGLALSVLAIISPVLRLLWRRARRPDQHLPLGGAAGNAA